MLEVSLSQCSTVVLHKGQTAVFNTDAVVCSFLFRVVQNWSNT